MSSDSFDTVLVANRGEIAVRVIRTLRAMGIRSVAVFSDADAGARHVARGRRGGADRARRRAQSYLIIDAVRRRPPGAPARRPSTPATASCRRTPQFADGAARPPGIVFIGPPAAAIETMGDKIRAKAAGVGVRRAGRARRVAARSSPTPI